ncbi:hypothetical protein RRG08_012502 [Elysia crispata]|uniref:Uncharacterized protein n=1 Tax=Elysia crispata TaxID=231223 RepID=A0AAE1ANW7_9GAST|nr:hypothetical protein RRG08_012502 [Elysia crispata]
MFLTKQLDLVLMVALNLDRRFNRKSLSIPMIKSSDAQGQCEAKVRFRCPTGENDYFGELFVLRRFKKDKSGAGYSTCLVQGGARNQRKCNAAQRFTALTVHLKLSRLQMEGVERSDDL